MTRCPTCGRPEEPAVRQVGQLVIDTARGAVRTVSGLPLRLTPTQYRLLARLAACPGSVVDYADLGEALRYEAVTHAGAKESLKVHMARIRAALRAADAGAVVHTVRELGYLLEAAS